MLRRRAFDLAGSDQLQGGLKSPVMGIDRAISMHSGCPPIFKKSPNHNGYHPRDVAVNALSGPLFPVSVGATTTPSRARTSRGDLPPPGRSQGGVPLEFGTAEVRFILCFVLKLLCHQCPGNAFIWHGIESRMRDLFIKVNGLPATSVDSPFHVGFCSENRTWGAYTLASLALLTGIVACYG